jgi:hypothetical protein
MVMTFGFPKNGEFLNEQLLSVCDFRPSSLCKLDSRSNGYLYSVE